MLQIIVIDSHLNVYMQLFSRIERSERIFFIIYMYHSHEKKRGEGTFEHISNECACDDTICLYKLFIEIHLEKWNKRSKEHNVNRLNKYYRNSYLRCIIFLVSSVVIQRAVHKQKERSFVTLLSTASPGTLAEPYIRISFNFNSIYIYHIHKINEKDQSHE
jgi:hypothetical protein